MKRLQRAAILFFYAIIAYFIYWNFLHDYYVPVTSPPTVASPAIEVAFVALAIACVTFLLGLIQIILLIMDRVNKSSHKQ